MIDQQRPDLVEDAEAFPTLECAPYREELQKRYHVRSVKQHLSALRRLFGCQPPFRNGFSRTFGENGEKERFSARKQASSYTTINFVERCCFDFKPESVLFTESEEEPFVIRFVR